jgi:hypothetical protein
MIEVKQNNKNKTMKLEDKETKTTRKDIE